MFRIKELREKTGLTQEDLAQEVEVTSQYISMIENEHKLPSIPLLKKIAVALNTTVKNLYKDEMEPTQKEVV